MSGIMFGIKKFGDLVYKTRFIVALNAIFFTYNYNIHISAVALSEGWNVYLARLWNLGQIPYRDFPYFLPPVNLLILKTVMSLFGDRFFVIRLFGLLVSQLTITFMYLLLRRIFQPIRAQLATIIGFMIFQSSIVFFGYNFYELMILATLMGIFCFFLALEENDDKNKALIFATASGFFLNSAFLLKHSDGAVICAGTTIILATVSFLNRRRNFFGHLFVGYAVGQLIPSTIFISWLAYHGILFEAFDNLVLQAAATKGGTSSILTAWLYRFINPGFANSLLFWAKCLCYVFAISLVVPFFKKDQQRYQKFCETRFANTKILLIFLLLVHSLYLFVPFKENGKIFFDFWGFLYLTHYGVVLFTLIQLFSIRKNLDDPRIRAEFILYSAGLFIALATGTSAAIWPASTFLIYSIFLTSLFSIFRSYVFENLALLFVAIFVFFSAGAAKISLPYVWWSLRYSHTPWNDQVIEDGYLSGCLVDSLHYSIYHDINKLVREHTAPEDEIFSFPMIPIFYLLTDRHTPTRAKFHWFDVTHDEVAERDAEIVLERKPKVIINLIIPKFVWNQHENIFRSNGKQLGQRKISKAIHELTSSKEYVLKKEYKVPENNKLQLWIRKT